MRSITTTLSNMSLTVVFSSESLPAAAMRAPEAFMLGQRLVLAVMLDQILSGVGGVPAARFLAFVFAN